MPTLLIRRGSVAGVWLVNSCLLYRLSASACRGYAQSRCLDWARILHRLLRPLSNLLGAMAFVTLMIKTAPVF